MPRSRQYASAAHKQAAYRARQEANAGKLREHLYQLEKAVWEAADRGDELARSCASGSFEQMLQRLAQAFEARPHGQEASTS